MQQPGSITFGTPAIPASSAPAFGATPSLFGTSAPAFGATPIAGTGFNFGTSTASTAPKFGAPTTTPSLFGTGGSFVAPATSANTGFNFGAPATATSTGFNFGTPAATTASAGLPFGAQASGAAPSFGATPLAPNAGFAFGPPASSTSALPAFGTAVPASTGLGFGTNSNISFKGPTTTTNTLNFGGTSTGLSFGTTTTTPSLAFGLSGLSTPSTSAAPPPFNIATCSPSLNLGALGGKPPSLSNQSGATSAFVGLGGVRSSADTQNIGSSTESAKNAENKAAKENKVPSEIQSLIETFKNHVKQQKSYSSDIARSSIKPLRNVSEGIEMVQKSMIEIGNELLSNRQKAAKLKFETAKCLSHAEMAQRTHDTPPGFQFDNTAPLKYFIDTVNQFEVELNMIRQKIEVAGKHILSVQHPKALTSQELTVGMRKLHETFIALAGRLQSVHARVESHKEQFLNFRKHVLKDDTDIFKKSLPSSIETYSSKVIPGMPKRAAGPTPFSTLGSPAYGFLSQIQPAARAPPAASPLAYPGTSPNTTGWGASVDQTPKPPPYGVATGLSSSVSLQFGQTSQTGDSFQLQKPPTGNKRGKH